MKITLDIPRPIDAQLQVVRDRTKAVSVVEVLTKALALYDLATEHKAEGGSIIFKHADGTEEPLTI